MPSTRRAFLGACTAVSGFVAGCGESPDRDDMPTTTRDGVRTPVDAETRRLRYDGDPLVASTHGDPTDGSTVTEDEQPRSVFLIATADEREKLRYRARPDGWRGIQTFVEETDLSRSTLLLVQQSIGECYLHRLVRARMEDDSLDIELCRQLRPATVACDRETQVMEVLAVRLPFAIGDLRSYSIGSGSGCPLLTTEGEE